MQDSRLVLWKRIHERSGKKPQGLDERPELPDEAAYIWGLYISVRAGCEAVTYEALHAYLSVTGENISAFESSVLVRIEQVRGK